jgi:PAP2 superfamily
MNRWVAPTLVAALVFVCAPVRPAAADDTVVVQWNETMLQGIRNTGFAPMLAARAFAVMHTAMFDAWAAYDATAVGTRFGGTLRRPQAERTGANKAKAVSFAAYRALLDLIPSQAPLFTARMVALGYDPWDVSLDVSTPQGLGNECARTVTTARHGDGSNQLAGYADTTGYVPVNSSAQLNDPNRWQPLVAGTADQRFLAPHWGLITPFALASPSELRPAAPPQYPHGTYRKEVNQILHFSATLTDRQKTIATYWADGPATETPPGHWNLFAQFVSRRDRHSLDEDVKMFFALGNALLDASIAAWDAKVHYDFIRPVSAIRFIYAGKPVRAWGGPGRGTVLLSGDTWRTYIGTPPFSEYVSGHSTFSAASAEILKLFTGSDAFGGSVTFAAGSSPIEPGLVPARPVTLAWATFSAAAGEAGISRRYGGIHFESGDVAGRAMGRRIATRVWQKAREYFEGTAR